MRQGDATLYLSPQREQVLFLGGREWLAKPSILLQQIPNALRQEHAPELDPVCGGRWPAARACPGVPQDWTCGDKQWIVRVAEPFGGIDETLKDLKAKVSKDREIKFRAVEGARDGQNHLSTSGLKESPARIHAVQK